MQPSRHLRQARAQSSQAWETAMYARCWGSAATRGSNPPSMRDVSPTKAAARVVTDPAAAGALQRRSPLGSAETPIPEAT
jgi:hypothetical protein